MTSPRSIESPESIQRMKSHQFFDVQIFQISDSVHFASNQMIQIQSKQSMNSMD